MTCNNESSTECENMTSPEIANNETMHCSKIGDNNPFIMVWWLQLIYITAFVSMVIVAAGGNAIVIWIVVAHKRMRTVTNYFLLNLAIADALISIMNTLFNFVYMLYSDWPFGRIYCKVSQFIATSTISASTFTFMAIAIDRYIAIIYPLKPRMRAGTARIVIVVIWIVAVLVAFPNLLFAQTHTWMYCDGDTRTVCYLMWPDGFNSKTDFAYNVFIMLMTYFVPLFALAGTYTRVGVELWGSKTIGEVTARQEENIRSKRKVVRMLIVVVLIFAICWLPQHLFFLISNRYIYVPNLPYIQHVYLVIYFVAMSNSMYNPIIYCWMNARFRQGFKYVFRRCPCIHYIPTVGTASHKLTKTALHLGRTNTSISDSSKYTYVDRNDSVNIKLKSVVDRDHSQGVSRDSSCVPRDSTYTRYQYTGLTQKQPGDNLDGSMT